MEIQNSFRKRKFKHTSFGVGAGVFDGVEGLPCETFKGGPKILKK